MSNPPTGFPSPPCYAFSGSPIGPSVSEIRILDAGVAVPTRTNPKPDYETNPIWPFIFNKSSKRKPNSTRPGCLSPSTRRESVPHSADHRAHQFGVELAAVRAQPLKKGNGVGHGPDQQGRRSRVDGA